VMIEAMACGTPVIAWRHGSAPEVIDDGITGFIVEGLDEAVRAVEKTASFDRRQCRQVFERRFTASRMAGDYVNIYERLLDINSVADFGVNNIKHNKKQIIPLISNRMAISS